MGRLEEALRAAGASGCVELLARAYIRQADLHGTGHAVQRIAALGGMSIGATLEAIEKGLY